MKRFLSGLRLTLVVPLLALAMLAFVPLVSHATDQSFYVTFFTRITIFAIAASALNLALGYAGLVSFGHALFLGIGAYSVALPIVGGNDSALLHVFYAVFASAIVAILTGVISLRTSGIAFIMITLAFGQMGYFLMVSLKQFGGDEGLPIPGSSMIGSTSLGNSIVLFGVSFVILLATLMVLGRMRSASFGMVLRGASANARRVNALGIASFRHQLVAYTISGMLCALSGALLANLDAFASPNTMAWTVSGELIVMVVLGGMGTVFGPLLGAIAFLLAEELLKGYTEHWMLVFGPLIILVSLLGKGGLIGFLESLDRRVQSPVASVRTLTSTPQEHRP
nr:branched-chain amino acid ABC transporter permease [uncultured Cupriavidus sp.]